MAALTPAAVRKQIKTGRLDPLYLILGEDEAEKASLAAEFTEIIEPALRAFNVERLYAGETKVADLVDAARILPLMAPRRIVLLLQADRLLSPQRESERADRELDALAEYVKAPEPHASVVLVAESINRGRRISKLLLEHATVVECGGIQDAAGARRWVRERAAKNGMQIEPRALELLVERAGDDYDRLRADADRLFLYALGESTITAARVAEIVGPAAAQGGFALSNAMERGNVAHALRELALLLDEGGVPVMILGQLRSFVERSVPSGGIQTAVEAVMRTDLALKTSAGDHRVLLERLVVGLCDEKLRAKTVRAGLLF